MANYSYVQLEDAIKALLTTKVSYLPSTKLVSIAPDDGQGGLDTRVLPTPPFAMLAMAGMTNDLENAASFADGQVWREQYIWSIYVVAKSFRSAEKLLRGDATQIGAYDLIEDVVAALQNAIILADTSPLLVQNAVMVLHRPAIIVYRIDVIFEQDRSAPTVNCP